jgi:hypothetical protein
MSCWHLMRHPQHAPRAITMSSARTSVTCEPFFIYCSWYTEGHDMHAFLEPLCAGQPGLEPSATWWLPSSLAGLGAMGHVVAPESPRAKRQGSLATRHVVVPEPSHLGSRDPELRDSWHRVDAHPAPSPNLEFVCRGAQSVGYRQRPPGPPCGRL